MTRYTVYFEIYGKKMKTVVHANSEKDAKEHILSKVIFHKVDGGRDHFKEAQDILDAILNGLKK